MAKVVVDEELVQHPGIRLIATRLRWKPATALGTVILMRHQTRAAGLAEGTLDDILPHMPCDPAHRRGLFDVLVQAGFIRQHNGPFFLIEGNPAYLALIEKRRAAGRKGRAQTEMVSKERLRNRERRRARSEAAPAPKRKSADAPMRRCDKPRSRPANPATAAAWDAYSEEFTRTWGVEPTRNLKVNACVAQFVKRVGAADAPEVLRFYVRHTDALYLRGQHPLTLAVRDAEGLHVQWRRGMAVTGRDIRQMERGVAVRSQLRRIEAGEI